MQVLPLLTTMNFSGRKRTRSEDDFESNYLKKRLISTPHHKGMKETPIHMEDTRGYVTPSKHQVRIDDMDQFLLDNPSEDPIRLHCNHEPSRIDMLDFNGTMLPMEHKTGETRYCIPEFVLNKRSPPPTSKEAAKSGQLILFQPNTLLPPSPPNSPAHEKEDHDGDDPMDID